MAQESSASVRFHAMKSWWLCSTVQENFGKVGPTLMAPVIAQLVERETVVGNITVISRSAVRLRLAGGAVCFM